MRIPRPDATGTPRRISVVLFLLIGTGLALPPARLARAASYPPGCVDDGDDHHIVCSAGIPSGAELRGPDGGTAKIVIFLGVSGTVRLGSASTTLEIHGSPGTAGLNGATGDSSYHDGSSGGNGGNGNPGVSNTGYVLLGPGTNTVTITGGAGGNGGSGGNGINGNDMSIRGGAGGNGGSGGKGGGWRGGNGAAWLRSQHAHGPGWQRRRRW